MSLDLQAPVGFVGEKMWFNTSCMHLDLCDHRLRTLQTVTSVIESGPRASLSVSEEKSQGDRVL